MRLDWMDLKYPGRHRKNMQDPHRKGPSWRRGHQAIISSQFYDEIEFSLHTVYQNKLLIVLLCVCVHFFLHS